MFPTNRASTKPGEIHYVVYLYTQEGPGYWGMAKSLIPYRPECPVCLGDWGNVTKGITPPGWLVQEAWGSLRGGVTAVLRTPTGSEKRLAHWNRAGRMVSNKEITAIPKHRSIALGRPFTNQARGVLVTGDRFDAIILWNKKVIARVSPPGSDFVSVLPGPLRG